MDSFGRLLHAGDQDVEREEREWQLLPARDRFATLPLLPLHSNALETACANDRLPFGEVSRAAVGIEFCKWFDSVVPWLELVQRRLDEGFEDSITKAPAIRYDDFVDKEKRADVVGGAGIDWVLPLDACRGFTAFSRRPSRIRRPSLDASLGFSRPFDARGGSEPNVVIARCSSRP